MPPARLLNRSFLFTPEDLFFMGVGSCLTYLPCGVILGVLTGDFSNAAKDAESYVFGVVDLLAANGVSEYRNEIEAETQLFVDANNKIVRSGFGLVVMFGLNFFINAAMSVSCCRGAILETSKRTAVMPLAISSIVLCLLMMAPLAFLTHTALVGVKGTYALNPEFEEFLDEYYRKVDTRAQSLDTVCIFAWIVVVVPAVVLLVLYSVVSGQQRRRLCITGCAVMAGCTDVLESDEAGESAIKDEVQAILGRIFGILPLFGSDFPSGLQLLAHLQKQRRQVELLGGDAAGIDSPKLTTKERLCAMTTPPCLPEPLDESLAKPLPIPLNGCERSDLGSIKDAAYYLPWAEASYGTTVVCVHGDPVCEDPLEPSPGGLGTGASFPAKTPDPLSDRNAHRKKSIAAIKKTKSTAAEINRAVFNLRNSISNLNHRKAKKEIGKLDPAVHAQRNLLENHLKVAHEDILDIRIDNQALGCVPYFIALDRARQTITLSIRGSASLQDALTDLITTAAPILFVTKGKGLFDDLDPPVVLEDSNVVAAAAENRASQQPADALADMLGWSKSQIPWEELEARGGYGHRGIVVAAAKLWDDICSQGILAAAAAGRLPGLPELAHWRVLVTGHSLGAGLAALMTWALKPDLKGRVFCWAYEPPGGLVSPAVAEQLRESVTSVVNAKDLVSRMTWSTLGRLEDELMEAVALSKVNKNIFWLAGSRLNPRRKQFLHYTNLFHDKIPLTGEVAAAMEDYRTKVKEEEFKIGIKHSYKYGLPGSIMYLRPLKVSMEIDKHTGMRDRVYDAVWITNEHLDDDGILVARTTTADHEIKAIEISIESAENRMRELFAGTSASPNGCPRHAGASEGVDDQGGQVGQLETSTSNVEIKIF